jgi:hypothetical protein
LSGLRDGDKGISTGVILVDAILELLTEHRGESFCAGGLALKLRGAREMTSAIAQVEGRGVRRVYGVCSVCGNQRLVASLPPSGGATVA